ncbi:hypothetical protein NONI108955_04215 [Nocardia ninae]|uniref:Uncharacterized protein n=1 Tax=Nocardia ninae NBRC 108245 TaxID=1210091 RepID=A0A511MHX1_9NOCA|nr:hypothetical protein [Nocardia ninae]GEM40264.1 hypothetical protein NN4_47830 [Nocardia ninae NBRC 108245]
MAATSHPGGPINTPPRNRTPRRSLRLEAELPIDSTEFADLDARLVRHLFDVGLRLHHLEEAFDHPDPTPQHFRTAGAQIQELIDDLDGLIRDTGLAVLARLSGKTR